MDSFPSYQGGAGGGDSSFKRLSQTVGSNIQKISQNVSSMSKMVNQLQTPQDSQELRNQLRHIQHYTQQLAKDTSEMLKELMGMVVPAPEQAAAKLTKNRLSDEYIATLNAFQSMQKSAAQKTKEEVRKSKAASYNINEAFSQGGNDGSLIEMDSTGARRQEQLHGPTEREMQLLEERERDMHQLETDILAVNDIFKELGTMIHDQGTVVDSIEASIEHTSVNVEAGAAQLREAGNYQNKARRKKVYLLIALGVVIAIIIIIILNH